MSAVAARPAEPRGYWTRLADPERDRAAVIALWQRNLGDASHRAEKFDWFYRSCPFGTPLLMLLYHDDALIGCSGVAPRRMRWRGNAVRAGLLADIAVDASHRTLGPALMLQQALIAAAAGQFDLLYGFPNRKSLPVATRLGYANIGELTRHSYVLRHTTYLRRYLPRWLATPIGAVLDHTRMAVRACRQPRSNTVATWSEGVDPRMDALWQRPLPDAEPIGVRDTTTNRWRFDDCPLNHTRYLLLADHPEAPLRAWFACQVHGTVLCICSYWSDRGSTHVDASLVATLIHAARSSGHTSISFVFSGCEALTGSWQSAGFVARESQPAIAKWLDHEPAGTNPDRPWFLTEADEDE